jgi:16S rRNA (guanine527-N7)-methyltransferase
VKSDVRSFVEALGSERLDRLRRYERLLLEVALPRGFISESDRNRIWERHVLDSIRGVACLPERPVEIVDIGSGAGLPGIPVAISRPDCPVTLLEPKRSRAAFLELVVESLPVSNVRVEPARAEARSFANEIALARALADPRAAWKLAAPLLRPSGALVYFAGASWCEQDVGSLSGLGVRCEICVGASFPWEGPLVKMTRGPASGAEESEHER